MKRLSALRAAVVLAGVLTLQAAPALAGEVGPGPEELAALSLAAPAAASPMRPELATASPSVGGVGLPRDVLEAAGAYRLYMRQAAAVTASFADGASVASALKAGAAYEPKQLARGAVAFAAVAALQEPAFVQALRAQDPTRRAELAAELVRDPYAAAALPGARAAAGRAAAALAGEGERVRAAGQRIKQAAYDVQRQSWAKGEVTGRVERLAAVKTLSAQTLSASATELAELQLAALGASRLELPSGAPEPAERPVIARGLALAALAVLGEADSARTEPLLDDAACGSCLRMSKLNLFQCLAVAKPWYEDVFCLGQHVLIDTGDCIQTAARRRPAAVPPPILAEPRREPGPASEAVLTEVAALN
jgi:hypothetical protein